MKSANLSIVFLCILILALVLGGCSEQDTVSETNIAATDIEELLKNIFAAYNAHDAEKLLSYMAEDMESVGTDGTIYRGKEEIRASYENLFSSIPDYRLELISFFASGDEICTEWIASGTPTGTLEGGIPATGKSYRVRGATISVMRGDKFVRSSTYFDTASRLEQLGILSLSAEK
jgi:steroid delta-isomerase-like uncharacterized protein